MEVFRTEIRVGLLILVSFIVLTAGIFITSNIKGLWDKKKEIVCLFPYADGITKGSPVWYSGLEVGEVSRVRLAHDDAKDRIAVSIRINPDARVRKNSRVDIRSLGMMGAKYVEITPGSPDSPELAPGEVLEGRSSASLSEVIETGQQVASHLIGLIQETQAFVHDVRSESSIKETFENANAFLVDLRQRVKGLDPLVQKLDTFANTLNVTGEHLKQTSGEGGKELTALLREVRETNQGLQKQLARVEGKLVDTLGRASGGFSEAQVCVKDMRSIMSQNEESITSLLRNLSDTSHHLEALSEDLRAHPWKVVWKKDGTYDQQTPVGSDQWREKGRIGPNGKEE